MECPSPLDLSPSSSSQEFYHGTGMPARATPARNQANSRRASRRLPPSHTAGRTLASPGQGKSKQQIEAVRAPGYIDRPAEAAGGPGNAEEEKRARGGAAGRPVITGAVGGGALATDRSAMPMPMPGQSVACVGLSRPAPIYLSL